MVVENAKSETKRLNNKLELNEQSAIYERYIAMAAIEQVIGQMIKTEEEIKDYAKHDPMKGFYCFHSSQNFNTNDFDKSLF